MDVTLRRMTDDDGPFLWTMVYYASHSNDEPGARVQDMPERPWLASYVVDWGREGDLGVIATTTDAPIGAAWLRVYSATQPSYGWVDAQTPEIAIAVLPGYEGRGIGTRLLRELLTLATMRFAAVSLSVRSDNPARRLYERMGFRTIAVVDNRVGTRSETMVLRLQ